MSFPVAVGEFRREKVKRYDTEGRNVSVGYNLWRLPRALAATVYVYPSPSCASLGGSARAIRSMKEGIAESEFEVCKSDVLEGHPGARLVSEGPLILHQGEADRTGRRASFEYEDSFAHRRQPLQSELYVFCYVGDRWTVKYRFTHPAGGGEEPDIEQFLRDFAWTLSGP